MRIYKIFNSDAVKIQITKSEAFSILSAHDKDQEKLQVQFLKDKHFKSYKCQLYIEEGITYPDIEVDLSEIDGNAFSILGYVSKAMRKAGLNEGQVMEYREEAMKGDYHQLLSTTAEFVNVI